MVIWVLLIMQVLFTVMLLFLCFDCLRVLVLAVVLLCIGYLRWSFG